MKTNNEPNKSYETEDGTVWDSRSIAVCVMIMTADYDVLVTQRADNEKLDDPGKWCLPCGYLDRGESIHQCLIREIFEEVGLDVTKEYCWMYHVGDAPHHERQNVSFHFIVALDETTEQVREKLNFDPDEVQAVEFLAGADIKTGAAFNGKEFAFNHEKRLRTAVTARQDVKGRGMVNHECVLDGAATTQFKFY